MTLTTFSRLLLAAAVSVSATTAVAATVTIGASKDATIFQNPANNSAGAGNGLLAGTNGQTSPRRALLEFDVSGAVPAGATVQSVQLTLTLAQVAGMAPSPPAQTIGLHVVAAEWGEGSSLLSNPKTDSPASQGNGAAASTGDATWSSAMHMQASWTTAGGEFALAASGTASPGASTQRSSGARPRRWSPTCRAGSTPPRRTTAGC